MSHQFHLKLPNGFEIQIAGEKEFVGTAYTDLKAGALELFNRHVNAATAAIGEAAVPAPAPALPPAAPIHRPRRLMPPANAAGKRGPRRDAAVEGGGWTCGHCGVPLAEGKDRRSRCDCGHKAWRAITPAAGSRGEETADCDKTKSAAPAGAAETRSRFSGSGAGPINPMRVGGDVSGNGQFASEE